MPETGKQAISVERERLEGKMAIPLGTKQGDHHLLTSRAELVACWQPSSTIKSWVAPYHHGFLDSVGHFYTVGESFIPKWTPTRPDGLWNKIGTMRGKNKVNWEVLSSSLNWFSLPKMNATTESEECVVHALIHFKEISNVCYIFQYPPPLDM